MLSLFWLGLSDVIICTAGLPFHAFFVVVVVAVVVAVVVVVVVVKGSCGRGGGKD